MFHRLKAKFKKPKEVESLEVMADRCTGCARCVEMCKREVFALVEGRAVVANLASCVGCGKCTEKMCNFGAIKLVLKNV